MANSQEQAIASYIEEIEALELDELVSLHCYYQHHDDDAARDACEPKALAATQALIADLPSLVHELVAPAFKVKSVLNEVRMGQSQFGGLPDVAPDFEWPLSTRFTVGDAANEYQSSSSASPVSMDDALPMSFIAQINLSDLSAETAESAELPDDGRLLIFMDYATWFQDEQKARTRIIWDRTDADQLIKASAPEVLVWLDELARADWAKLQRNLREEFGGDEEDQPFSSGFLPPAALVEWQWSWQGLVSNVIEVHQSEFAKRQRATGAADVQAEVTSLWPDELNDRLSPYHQILGTPFPEQDDPRYDAYHQSLLGRPVVSQEDFDQIDSMIGLEGEARSAHDAEQALQFRLLLELDIQSFLDMNTEGRFYFFLHEGDLAARNFDAVIVVYQQT